MPFADLPEDSVVIVGAGLAGLCCALELRKAAINAVVLEASDGVGGRVRTDRFEGFLLDRGFQILLTAYPECRRVLDYDALELQPFYPGALVRFEDGFHRVGDPFRAPLSAIPTLLSPIGSLADKFRIARLRAALAQYTVDQLFQRHEVTTRDRLAQEGFSAAIIDRFFRPFLGGIFLEPELRTSSRMFDFIFRMFADGDSAVPRTGMAAIPEQIASRLPAGTVRLNCRIDDLSRLASHRIVLATDGPEAARLLGADAPVPSNSVWCYYFSAERAPLDEGILVLNGDGTGPVNNCCVITNAAPSYGPSGSVLISASVLQTVFTHDEESVRAQLAEWFGAEAKEWRFLRRYFLPHAQPDQAPPALSPPQRGVRIRPGLYCCGDHRENASINGAMLSGRRAAEAIITDLRT